MLELALELTVKVSLLLGLGLVAVACLRARAAATRHWVLSVTVACALLLPAALAVGPTWTAPTYFTPVAAIWSLPDRPAGAPEQQGRTAGAGADAAVLPSGAPVTSAAPDDGGLAAVRWPGPVPVLATVWTAGAAVALGVLGLGLLRLRRLRAGGRIVTTGPWREMADEIGGRLGLRRPVRLLQSAHPTMLATWGLVRPAVTLPAGADRWSAGRMRVVLGHELAHARRGDWAIQLCGQVLCALFWFNPLAWLTLGRLRREGELACDDEVLRLGVLGPDYATELLDLVQVLRPPRTAWSPVVAMARPSGFERRITAMIDPSLRRHPLVRRTRIAIAGVLLALTVPLALLAQSGTATFVGTIVDPAGTPWTEKAAISFQPVGLEKVNRLRADREALLLRLERETVQLKRAFEEQRAAGAAEATLEEARRRVVEAETVAEMRLKELRASAQITPFPDGRFEVRDLEPGEYRLTVRLPGFEPIEETVTLGAGQRLERAIRLEIGSIEETVRVEHRPGAIGGAVPTTADPEAVARMTAGFAGSPLQPPIKLRNVNPLYPAVLADGGADAEITLDTVVTAAGVVEVRTVRAPVDPDLLTPVQPEFARAAVDAVRQWQYQPTRLNDVPVSTRMRVTVRFVDAS